MDQCLWHLTGGATEGGGGLSPVIVRQICDRICGNSIVSASDVLRASLCGMNLLPIIYTHVGYKPTSSFDEQLVVARLASRCKRACVITEADSVPIFSAVDLLQELRCGFFSFIISSL